MIQAIARNLPCNRVKSKKGFTLAELLIVIAIIAILIAIAIPIFSAQMDRARNRTIQSNTRAAMSQATSAYLLAGTGGTVTYGYTIDAQNNLQSATTGGDYTVTVTNGAVDSVTHPAFWVSGVQNGSTTDLDP